MTTYYTIKQAAVITGYNGAHLSRLAKSGSIPDCTRVGNVWQIPAAWVDTHKKPPTMTRRAKNLGISRQALYGRLKKNETL